MGLTPDESSIGLTGQTARGCDRGSLAVTIHGMFWNIDFGVDGFPKPEPVRGPKHGESRTRTAKSLGHRDWGVQGRGPGGWEGRDSHLSQPGAPADERLSTSLDLFELLRDEVKDP